jgi:hypothetical protein
MATVVIMPGGFHPFHAGHLALYQSAQRAFPDAEVYVAATNDTSARPFPFPVKEKLAKLAGVEPGHFVQVKSPFRAEEITAKFDPARDVLIFVRSEKDADKPPQAGGVKKDGSASYLQPLLGAEKLEPFAKHAYMAYLPTVEFGPGMTSATQIRTAWPTLNEKRKTALVMSLYPAAQKNPKLAQTVVKLLDAAIGTEAVAEGLEYADKLSGLVDLPVFNSSTNPNPSGVAKVVNTGDRIMVVMNVRGVNVPYYISTGSGGKASVPTGKWYPVFGVHSSGWLNKGGEDSINKFYGSKMLALNADRLNNALGDLSSVEAQIPFMKKTGIAIINKDLQPMSHSEVSANPDEFKKRVNSFLAKLGSDPFYQVKATQPQGVAPGSLNEFAPGDGDGDDEGNPLDDYPCYDCGSTIYMHHTRLCDFAEDNAIRDLPAEPGTQHWTGRVPKGLKPIPGLSKGVEETVSANGTIANTSGAGAGMSASYQRRDNQPVAEDYLDERRL